MKIGIMVKTDDNALKTAQELKLWFNNKGVQIILEKSEPVGTDLLEDEKKIAPSDLDCIFVLGGDGTFLNAVRWIGNQDLPILGVKFGTVGFLADITEENIFDVVQSVLNKKYTIEKRMRLCVTIIRDNQEVTRQTVLNDVVINKGALARLASIKTYIDEDYLTTYRADGLIVCTPTGSTAYSLAAGGPIMHPNVQGLIIAPICPFTLTNRPLIIPDSVNIKIALDKGSRDIMLTFDGQAGMEISDKDTIIVKKSSYPVNIIKMPEQNYFDILKTKLQWSGGT